MLGSCVSANPRGSRNALARVDEDDVLQPEPERALGNLMRGKKIIFEHRAKLSRRGGAPRCDLMTSAAVDENIDARMHQSLEAAERRRIREVPGEQDAVWHAASRLELCRVAAQGQHATSTLAGEQARHRPTN